MNYIINIKTRDIIIGGIVIMAVSSKLEKKITKLVRNIKKEKEIAKKVVEECSKEDHETINPAIYCPCCGTKLADD